MDPLIASFERVLALGELPAALTALIGREYDVLPASSLPVDPVPVRRLIAAAESGHREWRRTLVLTSRPVAAARTGQLFGYADRRRRIAIVSTGAFGFEHDVATALSRLHNVLAHECGHLAGLRHCSTAGCLMSAVRSVAELDAREAVPCGSCPRAGANARRAGGLVALVVLAAGAFAALDGVARALSPPPRQPFACVPAGTGGSGRTYAGGALHLQFKGRTVRAAGIETQTQPLTCTSIATATTLNKLFQELKPKALEAAVASDGHAVVKARGVALLEGSAGAGVDTALEDAGAWANELDRLLVGKGWPEEGCAECHADRPLDMRNAVRQMRGG